MGEGGARRWKQHCCVKTKRPDLTKARAHILTRTHTHTQTHQHTHTQHTGLCRAQGVALVVRAESLLCARLVVRPHPMGEEHHARPFVHMLDCGVELYPPLEKIAIEVDFSVKNDLHLCVGVCVCVCVCV